MGKQPYSIDNVLSQRPTVKEYGLLTGEVKEFMDYYVKNALKPNKAVRVNGKEVLPINEDIWMLTWDGIIRLRIAVGGNEMLEALEIIYGIKDSDFLDLDLFNCFSAYKWISEQMKEMSDIHTQELGGEPTQEEKEAGIDMLEQFDYAVSLDALSNGDVLREAELLEQPYSIIFRKLCLNKVKADIQKNFNDNANRKAKANSR